MADPDEVLIRARIRRGGHALDRAILRSLREMISYCRKCRNRELGWYYDAAWEFASEKIYGPLPPRAEYDQRGLSNPIHQHPVNAFHATPDPPPIPGLSISNSQKPLRRIVKKFSSPYKTWELTYETLECGHILLAPAGYSVPAKSRRCIHCGYQKALARKKPANTTFIRAKAVSA